MKFLLALAFSLALFITWLRLESVTFAMEQIKNQPPNHSLMSAAPSEFVRNADIENWRKWAIEQLWNERRKMDQTPLIVLDKFENNALLVFKNESASKTGSLKHRYSWALIMWALLEGHIGPNTTVFEASSGNTARSEAYFCKLIGLKFVAVIPESTENAKIRKIEDESGTVIKLKINNMFADAERKAREDGRDSFYINQFGNSALAEEFHESGNYEFESVNVFHELLKQQKSQNIPAPTHFVLSAGTGGTITSVGRYAKKYSLKTEVVLADTEFSAYYDYAVNNRFKNSTEDPTQLWVPPGMAGTGFGYAGPIQYARTSSLSPPVLDHVLKVPDLASTAAIHILREHYGIEGGPSTGVTFAASLQILALASLSRNTSSKNKEDKKPVIAMLVADNGVNYRATYYNETWIASAFSKHGGINAFACWKRVLFGFLQTLESSTSTRGTDNGIENPLNQGTRECPPLNAKKDAK